MKPQFVSQFDYWHTEIEAAILTLRRHGHRVGESYLGADYQTWHIINGRAVTDAELIDRAKAVAASR